MVTILFLMLIQSIKFLLLLVVVMLECIHPHRWAMEGQEVVALYQEQLVHQLKQQILGFIQA